MLLYLVILILSNFMGGYSQEDGTLKKCSTNGVCLPNNYDKFQMPSNPINIDVGIVLNQISKVDDEMSMVEIQAHLIYDWKDYRLFLSSNAHHEKGDFTDNKINGWYLLHEDWYVYLWNPEIYVEQLEEVEITKNLPHKNPNMGR